MVLKRYGSAVRQSNEGKCRSVTQSGADHEGARVKVNLERDLATDTRCAKRRWLALASFRFLQALKSISSSAALIRNCFCTQSCVLQTIRGLEPG